MLGFVQLYLASCKIQHNTSVALCNISSNLSNSSMKQDNIIPVLWGSNLVWKDWETSS